MRSVYLLKLRWETGGFREVSERQMRHVVAILREQRGQLDEDLLERLAREFQLDELLKRARAGVDRASGV